MTSAAVLLPGLHGTSELFGPFVTAAPPYIRTILVDYPASEASMNILEGAVREKLADSCIVIAESFSGPIAIRVAGDDRVRALILCNSFIRDPFPLMLGRMAIAPLFSIPFPAFMIRSLLSDRRADPALTAGVQSALRRVPPRIVAGRIRQIAETDDGSRLTALRKPVLYLRGLHDRLVSERSWHDVQTACPQAQIARIRGPHMLLQVSPHECWRAILEFVDEFVGK